MKLGKFTGNMKKVFKWTIRTAVTAGIIAYLSSSVFTVSTQQESFRLRFGKIVNSNETIKPGIHFKWPWPFEEVVKVNVKHIYSLYLGNQSKGDLSKIWALEHGDNLEFISGDNNLFLPYVTVHYQISDPYLFYLSNEDSTEFLKQISLQTLTETFVTTPFYDLMLFKKKNWLKRAETTIQKKLDRHKTGLEIVCLILEDIHPPTVVSSSYESVVAAYQQKETMLNLAHLAKNKMLPDFRAEAQKIKNEAHSFAVTEINRKQGEAKNYLLRQEGYNSSGKIVSKIMKLEAATEILEGKQKVIIDKKTGLSRDMLYYENFINNNKGRR
jgi:membrane protease subunit HflK